jgi:hypothetical protein
LPSPVQGVGRNYFLGPVAARSTYGTRPHGRLATPHRPARPGGTIPSAPARTSAIPMPHAPSPTHARLPCTPRASYRPVSRNPAPLGQHANMAHWLHHAQPMPLSTLSPTISRSVKWHATLFQPLTTLLLGRFPLDEPGAWPIWELGRSVAHPSPIRPGFFPTHITEPGASLPYSGGKILDPRYPAH